MWRHASLSMSAVAPWLQRIVLGLWSTLTGWLFLPSIKMAFLVEDEDVVAEEEDAVVEDEETLVCEAETTFLREEAEASGAIVELAPLPPTDGLPQEEMLSHTCESFAAAVRARLGVGDVIARHLYRAYFRVGENRPELGRLPAPPHEVGASKLGARLLGLCSMAPPLSFAEGGSATPPAPGTTKKYVLVAGGGEEVEMVCMPAPGSAGAWSLCISSQIGCRMGCAFCETGRMGLLRNLSVAEIVSQVALAAVQLRLRVANVIFMGMGEPLDNVHAVIGAIGVLTEVQGLALPLSHVTVSTSGEAEHVPTLVEAYPAVRLAFSVHAADEALRSRLMPINRRVPLATLAQAMADYVTRTKRRVTIQYVLLAGVNDADEHADALAALLARVGPPTRLHVNLIPYNAQTRPRFATPSHERCLAFKHRLQHTHRLFVKIRVEKGASDYAACGQLGNVRLRAELARRRRREKAEARASRGRANEGHADEARAADEAHADTSDEEASEDDDEVEDAAAHAELHAVAEPEGRRAPGHGQKIMASGCQGQGTAAGICEPRPELAW